ncbi:peptidylprolyl isomerase [Planctobacterium marinum]|uniref:peptidylprolyl isomerase n=1 Tax=Planctobacterium marinum TaxID=1631968 RepID=A0AA48HPJ0_9ALTE|nr:peptidyl-prolyl cis-trans isomerase [Planctobacterium marinum]
MTTIKTTLLLFLSCFLLFSGSAFAQEFRDIADDKLFIIETGEGKVYVELAPEFAPKHVERIIQLSRSKQYQGTEFYRVIDGFVAQAGPGGKQNLTLAPLQLEALSSKNSDYTLVQSNDLFAPFTAFSKGFAIALNQEKSEYWLTHCPGVVAMARGNDPHSATSDFYITIGQAPRYLDRIMTIFGRVVYGMDVVQRTKRGVTGENGLFPNQQQPTKILATYLASELPEKHRPGIRVEKTEGGVFEQKLQARKNRNHAFFFEKPPAVLDVCQVPLAVEFEAPETPN